jgi:hypothetical protein
METLYEEIKDWTEWQQSATEALGGRDRVEELAEEKFFYDDSDVTGHVYWWLGETVAVAPAPGFDGHIELENVGAAGVTEGAEFDLYGRECLIAAVLAERHGDADRAAHYRSEAQDLFSEAEQTDCMHWAPENRPAVRS